MSTPLQPNKDTLPPPPVFLDINRQVLKPMSNDFANNHSQ